MDANAVESDAVVNARDVRVRAVWQTLASPLAVAFVTDGAVALLDRAGMQALVDDGDELHVGPIRIGGTVDDRRALLDEARQVPERDYAEMGDVGVVAVGDGVELRRESGDGLQESAAAVVAAILEHERNAWRNLDVAYAKWSFGCAGKHFVTTPLRAAFVAERIATALAKAQ